MEKRTDLALEVRESFPKDQVEIQGVSLEKREYLKGRIRITTVEILNEAGEQQMKKPKGSYITIEITPRNYMDTPEEQKNTMDKLAEKLAHVLEDMLEGKISGKREHPVYLVAGLGNRFATPDALGPFVLEDVGVNRHIRKEFGEGALGTGERELCAVSPGVMAQTGMESQEILGGIIDKVSPAGVVVIDALASRSVNRLCTTIQITDTGICPGAGIGNNRNALNQSTLGVPVIAIGVPTVVDAGTIVSECMETSLQQEGYSEQEIDLFLQRVSKVNIGNLFVTPKDIDSQIREIGKVLAKGINIFAKGK